MKYINVPIPDLVKERLNQYAKQTGLQKKKVIELALTDYLKKRIKPVL